MKKIQLKVAIFFLCLLSTIGYSQTQNALKDKSKIEKLEIRIDSVSSSIADITKTMQAEFKNLSENQVAIKNQFQSLTNKLNSLSTEQNTLKDIMTDLNQKTDKEITSIKKDTLTKFLVVSLSILFTLLIIIVIIVVFQKKFKKVNVVEESIKIDAKVSEMLENQLVLLKKEAVGKKLPETEIDHSLPVSVGNEIFRMRKRIKHMDENTKGIHALKNALTRLEDEFNRQGYTIKDLTGQSYVDELTVKITNTIRRDDLEPGEEIISRMITPQIFHNGVAVSHGEAELSISSKNMKQP
ncbi:hypothetical protein AUJ66_04135 [Candidatus Desantisbacteria bacterium CG1_02_38_46]|uniref:Nucleotide exchange factor GrpE n=1 Tax=Candidatus Desantisbacteria bacterium CG1_02_38_46 TaxID=1817893 RepID=A0A1J4SEU9_9BACT|nr:MAG: hypothetical protein AUJ66_04135 [Candidatus Desantisbacteria bacterium CG1_02_38_46]PIZ14404.1 MAG: hypothetical protein COY53_00140 [Elusimicrobia bacterium CG_4_10_14_0_8_um_filter_37_32]